MDPAGPSPTAAPMTSLVYADVPNRVIAYIIDVLVIFVFNIAVGIVLGIIGLAVMTGTGAGATTNWFGSIIYTVAALAVSGIYFVYSWTNQRATIGMKALSLQIGNAPEGATITTEQAIRRWLALGAVFTIAQILNPLAPARGSHRARHARVGHLPAVHDGQQPDETGLARQVREHDGGEGDPARLIREPVGRPPSL